MGGDHPVLLLPGQLTVTSALHGSHFTVPREVPPEVTWDYLDPKLSSVSQRSLAIDLKGSHWNSESHFSLHKSELFDHYLTMDSRKSAFFIPGSTCSFIAVERKPS